MRFQSTGTFLLNVMEAAQKNDGSVLVWYSMNFKLKVIQGFHLTVPCIIFGIRYAHTQKCWKGKSQKTQ